MPYTPSITIPLAVLAGLLSFISPCCLPLVPAYIGYLTGQATNTASSSLAAVGAGGEGGGSSVAVGVPSRWIVFLHGVFFVLGFTLVFVALGMTAGALGQFSRGLIGSRDWLGYVGGILIIILGLHTMGVIRIPFLYYDTRSQAAPRHELGFLGSMFMGVTFSAGWSPCIGPILGGLLTMGANTGSVGEAGVLLAFYGLGLGVPFLLTALLLNQATDLFRRLRKYMRVVEIASGVLLIIIGILVFTGTLQRLAQFFSSWTQLTITLDEWVLRLSQGSR